MEICGDCRYFVKYPFVRENDRTSYCMITDNETKYDNEACNAFKMQTFIEEVFE